MPRVRFGDDGVNPRYASYFLGHPHIREWIVRHAHGATMPNLNTSILSACPFVIPPKKEQYAIAHILGTLDDKIELNRRMNETLEAMARALFKSWFVDFDPVRAKMEGRDTGLPNNIADLFPDRMVDSKLGEIPEGWRIFRLDELADHHTQSMMPSANPDMEFEHFSIPAHDAGQMPAIDRGADIKSNKIVIPPDAVLLSKLNPEIPRVWMPDVRNGGLQICSTEFLAFTPRSSANRSLLFSLFTDTTFRTTLQSMVTGTSKSHQRASPKVLKKSDVLSGTPGLFDRFGEACDASASPRDREPCRISHPLRPPRHAAAGSHFWWNSPSRSRGGSRGRRMTGVAEHAPIGKDLMIGPFINLLLEPAG